MPIFVALASLLFLGVIFGPQLWVRHVMQRHGDERPDLPGTGAELARHLLDAAELTAVAVEKTDRGDHYDPEARSVRLLPQHYDGRSITAVAIAAHEVSHAVQHAQEEPGFLRRMEAVRALIWIERIGSAVLVLAPVVFILVRSPAVVALQVCAGISLLAIEVIVHLTTLPVEFDASFGKALPVLVRGRYLATGDLPAARSVLKAAAYTYVAAALATLLNIMRWLRILRL
ncbi:MAG: zinc metallopeptidase [Alphaproteobacteria bacterium]|nr:zinc metallopeptidase [Alphaproteobacteria bacterium]